MTKPKGGRLRVLLVEDETLVAMLLEDFLDAAGYEVIGPAQRLSAARDLFDKHRPDVVILDINIGGEAVYPFAAFLAERDIPFLFVTGYSRAHISQQFRDRPVLNKPFRQAQLIDALRAISCGKRV